MAPKSWKDSLSDQTQINKLFQDEAVQSLVKLLAHQGSVEEEWMTEVLKKGLKEQLGCSTPDAGLHSSLSLPSTSVRHRQRINVGRGLVQSTPSLRRIS